VKKIARGKTRVDGTKYRAVCDSCKFRGDVRATRAEAEQDAVNHLHRKGNEGHAVRVVATQTRSTTLRLTGKG
jgi:hypothetical protein